ncbi:MAG: hypothetical protein RLZZ338_828 [Cyanobacteriota bacterium]|jgi:hypothetical protein
MGASPQSKLVVGWRSLWGASERIAGEWFRRKRARYWHRENSHNLFRIAIYSVSISEVKLVAQASCL